MLTNNQKNKFADALVDLGWFCDPADALDDIVETRDTLADFIEAANAPHETVTFSGVALNIWLGIQRIETGYPRYDLAVADFGEFRAAFVS